MSWGKENDERIRHKGRGNKENLVKSLLGNISEHSAGENGRSFWENERISEDPKINNIPKGFLYILVWQYHNVLLLLFIHSFIHSLTSITAERVCAKHVLITRDIKMDKAPFLTPKCSGLQGISAYLSCISLPLNSPLNLGNQIKCHHALYDTRWVSSLNANAWISNLKLVGQIHPEASFYGAWAKNGEKYKNRGGGEA